MRALPRHFAIWLVHPKRMPRLHLHSDHYNDHNYQTHHYYNNCRFACVQARHIRAFRRMRALPCHSAVWFAHPKRMPRLHLHSTDHAHTPANHHTDCDYTPANHHADCDDHDYHYSSVCFCVKQHHITVVCWLH